MPSIRARTFCPRAVIIPAFQNGETPCAGSLRRILDHLAHRAVVLRHQKPSPVLGMIVKPRRYPDDVCVLLGQKIFHRPQIMVPIDADG